MAWLACSGVALYYQVVSKKEDKILFYIILFNYLVESIGFILSYSGRNVVLYNITFPILYLLCLAYFWNELERRLRNGVLYVLLGFILGHIIMLTATDNWNKFDNYMYIFLGFLIAGTGYYYIRKAIVDINKGNKLKICFGISMLLYYAIASPFVSALESMVESTAENRNLFLWLNNIPLTVSVLIIIMGIIWKGKTVS